MKTRLHEVRTNRKISQRDAAEKFGITQSYLSRLEHGEQRPSPELAARIAEEFELDERDLLYPERYTEATR